MFIGFSLKTLHVFKPVMPYMWVKTVMKIILQFRFLFFLLRSIFIAYRIMMCEGLKQGHECSAGQEGSVISNSIFCLTESHWGSKQSHKAK